MAEGDAYFKSLDVTLKGVPPKILANPYQLRQYAKAVSQNAGSGSYNWSEVESIVQQGTPLSGEDKEAIAPSFSWGNSLFILST